MILLTGSTGFLGRGLLDVLVSENVRCVGRKKPSKVLDSLFYQSEINIDADFTAAVRDISVVIHCAARVHIMNNTSLDPLSEFRAVNTEGTLKLARQAAKAGVKRFIFLSSIKVNGETTSGRAPFKFSDIPVPADPYSISKAEAEKQLLVLGQVTGMEIVVIRSPLIYGPGVKANFAEIMKLAAKNLPLPLGAIHNKRSLVALDNLVDLIVSCIDHPNAGNEIFLVSDDQDVSTTELLSKMVVAVGKTPKLVRVPMRLIQLGAILLGKKAVADRICGNLQVDISYTKKVLSWSPPITLEQGLVRCLQEK